MSKTFDKEAFDEYRKKLEESAATSEETKKLKQVLLDSLDSMLAENMQKERDTSLYLYLFTSVVRNISLKEAYERYEVRREVIQPAFEPNKIPTLMDKLEWEYYMNVSERREPIFISDKIWSEHVNDFFVRLASKMGIEI